MRKVNQAAGGALVYYRCLEDAFPIFISTLCLGNDISLTSEVYLFVRCGMADDVDGVTNFNSVRIASWFRDIFWNNNLF